MLTQRSAGILMHPTSLPSPGGIGDLGPEAYAFVDWLAAAKQTSWQVLPIGPVGYGNSPYSCTSAFAGNVLLISLDRLADRGLIARKELSSLPDGDSRVDYDSVRANKVPLLREAADNFIEHAGPQGKNRFLKFCEENSWWLDDYALFSTLREESSDASWNTWKDGLAARDAASLEKARGEFSREMERERFLQFAFFEQWASLHRYCSERGIRIIGDLAIFVSYDSADVWTHPEIFRLRKDLLPEAVAGVPPDAFSATGQRWGNPLYDWAALKASGYEWWIKRLDWAIETCDIVRLDHFRGFEAYWEIPADELTAENGHWVPGPNEDLFVAVRAALGELPFIAEDLGYITKEVYELRKKFQIPGMKVLQFGFGNRGAHIYLPHKYTPDSVVYTGTHDNDTTVGWWTNSATDIEKQFATEYLGIRDNGVAWAFIRGALTSVSNLAMVPVQDVLGLDSNSRMNVPSVSDGNWSWRLRRGSLTPELAARLAGLVEICDRDALVKTPSGSEQGQGEPGEDFAA